MTKLLVICLLLTGCSLAVSPEEMNIASALCVTHGGVLSIEHDTRGISGYCKDTRIFFRVPAK